MLNWLQIASLTVVALAMAPQVVIASAKIDEKDGNPSKLTLSTERICVFKDGYCLIVKQGTATTDKDGFVFTNEVPDAAVLGSFWAVPEEGKLKSMTAGWVETESESTRSEACTKVIEIIKANVGKKCKFTRSNNTTLEGTIVKLLEAKSPTIGHQLGGNQVSLQMQTPNSFVGRSRQVVEQTTASHFMLSTDSGDMLVAASDVNNLLIRNMSSELSKTVLTFNRQKRLTMKFAKPNSKVNISIMYFRPDVRWIPTYRVNLAAAEGPNQNGDQRFADLMLQGEILNEAEDLIDVPFSLVVGVPNFRFKTVPSPLTLESSLRNLLVQVSPRIGKDLQNGFSNAIYTNRASEFQSNRASGSQERSAVDLPEELTTKAGNDLFVYNVDAMTLKKGERASVPILSTKVEYRDIYTWEIDVKHSESFSEAGTSPLVLSENRIWRQVELINNTDIPWTTGAAMFVDGFQPVAQELLTYTSPGGICRVPVTVSVDLRGKTIDQETHRDPNAVKWHNRDYTRVNGQIEVELANNKIRKVPVEVRMRLGGKAKTAADDGDIRIEAYRESDWQNRQGDRINNSSVITWNADIEPGECFKPTVEYDFMIRQ